MTRVAQTKAQTDLTNALADAAWARADGALGEAWRDMQCLEALLQRAVRTRARTSAASRAARGAAAAGSAAGSAPGSAPGSASGAVDAGPMLAEAEVVLDALARAGRARGLDLFEAMGRIAPYDPEAHELEAGELAAGQPVRIVAPGVARVVDGGRRIVARARVRRVRAPSRAPAALEAPKGAPRAGKAKSRSKSR